MAGNFDSGPSRASAPLLATFLVSLLGAFGVAFIVVASGATNLTGMLTFIAVLAGIIGAALLVRAISREVGNHAYDWIRSRHARPANEYAPEMRRSRRPQPGANAPPSVDEIRDLKDGLHNWVPSNEPSRSRRDGR